MDLEEIDKIRQLTLIADDELMDLLVLKGANALSLIYGLKLRASIDLDFSLERDFGESDIDALRYKFERLLQKTFKENGYQAFDVTLVQKPSTLSKEFEDFLGGYRLEFKLIHSHIFEQLSGDIETLQKQAMSLTSGSESGFVWI